MESFARDEQLDPIELKIRVEKSGSAGVNCGLIRGKILVRFGVNSDLIAGYFLDRLEVRNLVGCGGWSRLHSMVTSRSKRGEFSSTRG